MSRFAPGTDPDYMNWYNATQRRTDDRAASEYGRGKRPAAMQRPKYTEGQTFNSDNAPGAKFDTPKDAPATFSPDTAQATKPKSAPRTTEQELDGIKKGQGTLGNIMSQFFPMEIESDDDGGRALKDGFAVGFFARGAGDGFFSCAQAVGAGAQQGEHIRKKGMRFAFLPARQGAIGARQVDGDTIVDNGADPLFAADSVRG